jgi:tetratricopeptide (TPR) repeat protein
MAGEQGGSDRRGHNYERNVVMASMGNYANVLKRKVAVARLRKVDDPLRLAHAVRHLGDAYYYAGRVSLADPCYVEALSIYRRHERAPPLDLANAIRSFAVLKDDGGATEEARRLWEEARELYVTVKVASGVAESAARLALLARRQGDLQRSREWLSEASAAADASNDPETLQYIREVRTQIED